MVYRQSLGISVLWTIAVGLCVSKSSVMALKDPVPDYCSELLSQMANALKDFDFCALSNSRPFTVCRSCALPYRHAFDLFNRFIKGKANLSRNCSMLIDGGKISLVTKSFHHITRIWITDGACEDCYNGENKEISREVLDFFLKKQLLEQCISSSNEKNQTCVKCQPQFDNLSHIFGNLLHSNTESGHFLCVDVLDAMNETRQEWGNMCFHEHYASTLEVIMVMSASLGLTIVFYLAASCSQQPKDIELARVNTWQNFKLETESDEANRVDPTTQEEANGNSHHSLRRQTRNDVLLSESQSFR